MKPAAFWLTAALAFGASAPESETPVTAHPLYRLKLASFVPTPMRAAGLILKARVNGGPELRMLLDSGAQFVILNRSAARASKCGGGIDFSLVEPGAPSAATAQKIHAASVQIGDLGFADAPLLIVAGRLPDGIQGVLPLSMFSGFLIRLDIPGKSLELLPYPEGDVGKAGVKVISSNQLLFVKATVNEDHEGLFLLDTGASYVALSRTMARKLNLSESTAQQIPLQGGDSPLDAALLNSQVRLQVGESQIVSNSVVAIDLSTSSRFHKFEVAGLLGYPALSNSAITVSYRDSLVRFEPK